MTYAQLYNYKTSSQPFLNNFPGILYVLRCLSQNKKFLTWKTAEPNRLHRFFSCHYIGSRQNGPLAGRWQMCQKEVVPNELLSTSDPSTHQQGAIETTFQSTKTITGVPRRSSTNPRFWLFWYRSSDKDPPRLNCQRHPRLKLTRILAPCMETLAWAKIFHNKSWKMAELKSRA